MPIKNSNDIIGNQTCNLLDCITVPQPTASPCALQQEGNEAKMQQTLDLTD
jgi:hypothetical protein